MNAPPRSPWNRFFERLLEAEPPLGVEEWRFAAALARLVIGFKETRRPLGDDLVLRTSRLHGRSLSRARDGLVRRGLIEYTAGSRGRGLRSSYDLLLEENPAVERAFHLPENPAEKPAEKPAPARARKLEVGSDTPLTPLKGGRRSREERKLHGFASKLTGALHAQFDSLAVHDREALVTAYSHSTGLRHVRGTHGSSWKTDPLGSDRPGAADRAQLPTNARKSTPEGFVRAWFAKHSERTLDEALRDPVLFERYIAPYGKLVGPEDAA